MSGVGVLGITWKEMGLRTHHLLDHREGSVFKVDPMCCMAMRGPTAALSGVAQMSKNEGKQVLSSDTEVNAKSRRGLLYPPVLG